MKMQKFIAKLHFITQDIAGFSHIEQAEQACVAGVRWIQFRMKGAEEREFEETARAVKSICKKYNSVFIINDNVELAMKVEADGVHLGKMDMLPSKARLILGPSAIIGGTANTLSDLLWGTEEGCDYLGVGPYRFTNTKNNLSPILESCGMIDLIEAYSTKADNPIPIIAIGGIKSDDVSELVQSGYHGVAVSSAIAKADDPAHAAKEFLLGFPSQEGTGVGQNASRRTIIPYNPQLKKRARKLRNNSTISEILLWQKLKGKRMKGFDFDRQRPIDNFIVDFYWKDLMLALEVDGKSHNDKFMYDVHRQHKLESLGVNFLRFTDLEVKKDMNNVLNTIENWIEETKLLPYGHLGSPPIPHSSKGFKPVDR